MFLGKAAIVLAAGFGTRMKSNRHKVLHEVCGKPMLLHIVDELRTLPFQQIIVVVGQQRAAVEQVLLGRAQTVFQEEQLGTGHAVRTAMDTLDPGVDEVVVLYGDAPLIRAQTISRLLEVREASDSAVALLAAHLEDPFGLGRVVLSNDNRILSIVEEKDATAEEKQIHLINAGTYAFRAADLKEAVAQLKADNAQREYYLTDTISILRSMDKVCVPFVVADSTEVLGVNDRAQLAQAQAVMQSRIATRWMKEGVTIIDPAHTYIGMDVQLASDVTLLPGSMLEGATRIGQGSVIGPDARISSSVIGDDVTVQYAVITQSEVDSGATVGPYAYIRPGSHVGKRVKVGDFVEIKNSNLGDDTKVSHLAYVGDADIGERVNVGCGAITVNYDGKRKQRTTIGDDSFVGSNVNLVAPLTIGKGSYLCAGSTISTDVPDDGFAIGRPQQVTKANYVKAWKERRLAKRD